MSKKITFRNVIEGVLTDVTSVVVKDPTSTFGVRRTDTNAIVVASNTAFQHVSTGLYQLVFNEPAANLSYEYWIEYVYLGRTTSFRQVTQPEASTGIGGSVSIAPSQYVDMGIEMVSCGDTDLEDFLRTHANLLWAMEQRRGVVLDLRYNYFVLALIVLAQDHVRMLVDIETMNQQMQETGYNNSTNSNSFNSTSERNRTSSSVQSATSSQSFERSATRTSTSTMSASASQTSERTGSGSDLSTQAQSVINRRTGSATQTNTTTPLPSGYISTGGLPRTEETATSYAKRNSHMESESRITTREKIVRFNVSVPFVGSLSGQNGFDLGLDGGRPVAKQVLPSESNSQTSLTAYDVGEGEQTRRNKVVGSGSTLNDSKTDGSGTRAQNVHRTSHSEMSGVSVSNSSGSNESESHDEQHREAESNFHSESLGHSESNANALAHREGVGASNMVASSTADKQYYDQIFKSLQQMYEDTLEQIKQLEKKVLLASRYVYKKLSTTQPQASMIVCSAGNSYAAQNPSAFTPIGNGKVLG